MNTHQAMRDLLASIDLHTDCMDGRIDREALDPWVEKAEAALAQFEELMSDDITERLDRETLYHANGEAADITGDAADEIRKLREALSELEDANDALCALRTREQYLSMIDGGQKPALLRLDDARRVARNLCAANKG